MGKIISVLFFLIVIFGTGFLIYNFFSERVIINYDSADNEGGGGIKNADDLKGDFPAEENSGISGAGVHGSSVAGSDSIDSNSESINYGGSDSEADFMIDPFCSLARPGNFPGVDCSAVYIKQNEVSINLLNTNEEIIRAEISLQDCSPTLIQDLYLNSETNFVFACNINGEYYEGDVIVIYFTEDGESPIIYGIVGGNVS